MSAYRRKGLVPPRLHPVLAALVEARRDQNLSQGELAERIGISASALSMWERGTRAPSFIDVARWAAALGFGPITLTRPEEASR